MALVLVLLTGCGQNKTQPTVVDKPAKGNCKVFDCIKKLDTKNTLEDVNKVMGFEGEKEREGGAGPEIPVLLPAEKIIQFSGNKAYGSHPPKPAQACSRYRMENSPEALFPLS